MSVRRLAAILEYDGGDFIGWQRQTTGRSVQAEVESALGKVADEGVTVVCAGRTDRGVHAAAQVLHFETSRERSPRSWLLGTNASLPPDVSLIAVREMPAEFHARFSAIARVYRYIVCERPTRPALLRRRVAWTHRRLDVPRMQEAAAALIGEHDFSAFRGADCQARSPLRRLERIAVTRHESLVAIEVKANAFLLHMVRNIAGSLLLVGSGRAEPRWLEEVLRKRDRRLAGPTAPARGLTLVGVEYPAACGIRVAAGNAGASIEALEMLGYHGRDAGGAPAPRPGTEGNEAR
ncbi:MAG TPA: tRNA pseudouridine(38-40) synthase TruA [Gammaproteobacteria bacterium]|nr:tRNA pseudouridine(38-40) synthase TruA [Gammaproteobacteria bacterium]